MSSGTLLTSTQVAAIAGVGVSTIKRWADQGALPFVRTAGGHRRFERSSVDRFVRGMKGGLVPSATPGEPTSLPSDAESAEERSLRWCEVLRRAQRHELDGALLEARSRLGRWCDVADEVAGGLREMGFAWQRAELSITEEHVASESLARALARVGDALPTRFHGPRVLLACAGGDEHTLALSLAELCVREAGGTPVWLGRQTPVDELVRALATHEVRMVALSASAACMDGDALQGTVDTIGEACQRAGAVLSLGGAGAWPDEPAHATRVRSFRAFHDAVVSALSAPHQEAL